jgi:hypothetical protein
VAKWLVIITVAKNVFHSFHHFTVGLVANHHKSSKSQYLYINISTPSITTSCRQKKNSTEFRSWSHWFLFAEPETKISQPIWLVALQLQFILIGSMMDMTWHLTSFNYSWIGINNHETKLGHHTLYGYQHLRTCDMFHMKLLWCICLHLFFTLQ